MVWRAALAALLAGWLLRWWGRLWINALHDAQRARQAALAKGEAAANSSSAQS